MAAQNILTPIQNKFIQCVANNKSLRDRFYLTGGTALAAYYLKHRYSEDLDFFSEENVDLLAINVFLKEYASVIKIKRIEFQQSFNRNIFFLYAGKETLKTEFTYFPFGQLDKPLKKDGIRIDSITDIAVNKIFTIYQNPRARDYIDIYCILKEYKNLSFSKLVRMARTKFDAQIDPIQFGTQLLQAKKTKDLPRMLIKIDQKLWSDFFIAYAKSLSKDIFV